MARLPQDCQTLPATPTRVSALVLAARSAVMQDFIAVEHPSLVLQEAETMLWHQCLSSYACAYR